MTFSTFSLKLTLIGPLLVVLGGCGLPQQEITTDEIRAQINEDVESVKKNGILKNNQVDLSSAIARSLKFNYEGYSQSLQKEISKLKSESAVLDILPPVVGSSTATIRDKPQATFSEPFVDGEIQNSESRNYSVSSNLNGRGANLSFEIESVQFGAARENAKQARLNFLVEREREKIVLKRLVKDTITKYWLALYHTELKGQISVLIFDVEKALKNSQTQLSEGLVDPLQALNYQKELYQVQSTMLDLQRDLIGVRDEFSLLMGLRPSVHYSIKKEASENYNNKFISLNDLNTLALVNNGNYLIEMYNEKINKSQKNQLLLNFFPSLSLGLSINYDDNPYLLEQTWSIAEFGLRWDIFNAFRYKPTKERLILEEELIKNNRLKSTVKLLSLTRSSLEFVYQDIERVRLGNDEVNVAEKILEQLINYLESERGAELAVIKAKQSLILARHNRNMSHVDLQSSISQLLNVSGLDVVPPNWRELSTEELSKEVEQNLRNFLSFLVVR